MTRRAAVGVLLVAALATGRAVELTLPGEDAASRPFERSGMVGEPVQLRWGTVEAGPVEGTTRIGSRGSVRVTGGVYLVVPVSFTAAGGPRTLAYAAIRGADGRTYETSGERNPFQHGGSAQPGIPRRMTAAVEVPVDAVAGAHLILTLQPSAANHRRDDVAVIDLGLTADDARAWAHEEDVVEIGAPADGPDDPEHGSGAAP